jgi:hypothetical protein
VEPLGTPAPVTQTTYIYPASDVVYTAPVVRRYYAPVPVYVNLGYYRSPYYPYHHYWH